MIRLIPKFILLMIIFFIISGISTYFTINYFIKNEKTVVVPDLVGEDIIYVLELLTNLGLNPKVKESEYSPDFAMNNIIYQDPDPGQVIKQGRDVRIIISKGTKVLSMPNLKGLNLQQALLIIEKNGLLEGSFAKTFHSKIKKDRIVAQYPLPGSETFRGISSNLLISLGTRPLEFVMPDLSGLFLDEAVLAAEKNHLKIDTIKMIYQKTKPDNIILNQNPSSGFHVLENDLINLEVNRKTVKEQKSAGSNQNKKTLFRYRLPSGYLKQHIRIELRAFDTTLILYDELMKPESAIWVAVPAYSVSIIFLYRNEELILSEIYD
ncbi:MAG: PASTA domain-containing protein [Desulfobacteraceae bacterium]|jgi:beta-lactam-binding protein with PASTA domain|nr:PASTA domain-containing protein [Desulfobacteraceae bacterium]